MAIISVSPGVDGKVRYGHITIFIYCCEPGHVVAGLCQPQNKMVSHCDVTIVPHCFSDE